MLQTQQYLLPWGESTLDVQDLYTGSSSRPSDVQIAVDQLAEAEMEERGAIFTRREVVGFILDLVGYLPEENLSQASLLEPSFGSGDFVLEALQRLLKSYFLHGGNISEVVPHLSQCLRAVELHQETFFSARNKVLAILKSNNISQNDAEQLANVWLVRDDFLLTPLPTDFTYIVGNPPYLRQELIPHRLITYYRTIYRTIFDRADLYVPFIERSLSLLSPTGKFSFICADRWMKNKYGGPLRELIANKFHLQAYIDMVDTDAFKVDVSAYPAVILLTTQRGSETYVAHKPAIDTVSLERLAAALRNSSSSNDQSVHVSTNVVEGNKPWIIGSTDKLTLLRRLEKDLPLLEDVGCKVGIGVATGCDSVYIGSADKLPIEEDRKLPLLMVADIQHGIISWNGQYIVNPFNEVGGLVDLDQYPLLSQYFSLNEEKIRNRNIAKKHPSSWYRTIDKINVPLTYQPKLLIPDIKGEPTAVLDEGLYYPHHNLYYVISTQWDLRALQAVLQSPIAKLFVSAYSVKIRGGYLRFQAQYIRRIRLPQWEQVSPLLRERLITASRSLDKIACNEAVFELYQLSQEERSVL